MREGASGHIINSCSSQPISCDVLASGEVSSVIGLLVSTSHGATCFQVAVFTWAGGGVGLLHVKTTEEVCQSFISFRELGFQ